MMIISYDIKSDKLRTKFNKFIKQYGERMQFSVYRIKNSKRLLGIIQTEIENEYKKNFTDDDSILIFDSDEKSIINYGYAAHEDEEVIVID